MFASRRREAQLEERLAVVQAETKPAERRIAALEQEYEQLLGEASAREPQADRLAAG